MTQDSPDGLTIREALNPWKHFVASDGIMSMAVHTADELAARLGLDPDMLVSDLHPTPENTASLTEGYPSIEALNAQSDELLEDLRQAEVRMRTQIRMACPEVWPSVAGCKAWGAPGAHGCRLDPGHEGIHRCLCGRPKP